MRTTIQTTTSTPVFYTKLFSLTLLCMFLLYMSKAGGQESEHGNTSLIVVSKDTLCGVYYVDSLSDGVDLQDIGSSTLIEFKVRLINGKAYTQWQVKGEREDGLFIIERSTDGKEYEQVGFKQGVGVPIYTPILYCWIDENPISDDAQYRLAKVYEDGRYYYSEVVGVSKGELIKPIAKDKPSLIAIQE